jgi:hypothetical protein
VTRRLLATLAMLAALLAVPTAASLSGTPASAGPTCINNDCAYSGGISYHGGSLLSSPQVYLVRFSDSATGLSPASGFPAQTFAASGPRLSGAINAVVDDPATDWWMQEYQTPTYPLTLGAYVATVTLQDATLADNATITDGAIQQALLAAVSAGTLPSSPNDVFVVVPRDNQTVTSVYSSACPYRSSLPITDASGNVSYVQYVTLDAYNTGTKCAYAYPFTPFANMVELLQIDLTQIMIDPGASNGWFSDSTGRDPSNACSAETSPLYTSTKVSYAGATYALQHVWSAKANACTTLRLPSSLRATLDSPSSVSATLTVQGRPIAKQAVTVTAGGQAIGTGTTDAAGAARISFAAQPIGTVLSVTASSDPALDPAKTALTIEPAATLSASPPTLVEANRYFSFAVYLKPAVATALTLTGPNYSYTTRTNSLGAAIVRAKAPVGLTTFTITSASPRAQTSFTVRAALPPTIAFSKVSYQGFTVRLTDPHPIARATLHLTFQGATDTLTTNANGYAEFSFVFPHTGQMRVVVSYDGSASTLPSAKAVTMPAPTKKK